MQGDKLNSHQVIARSNAGRHLKVLPAIVVDHAVDTPRSAAGVKSVFSDLEPSKPFCVGASCVADLGKVNHCWTLVTSGDGVVGIVSTLGTANNMSPPRAYASASRDVDDVVILELDSLVASEFGVVDILDGL